MPAVLARPRAGANRRRRLSLAARAVPPAIAPRGAPSIHEHRRTHTVAATQTPTVHGDEERLFVALADQLFRTVRAIVHGPDAMIEDACSFAWLQLVRCQPDRE